MIRILPNRSLAVVFAALVVVVFFAGSAQSEDNRSQSTPQTDTSGYDARLTTVRQLLRARNFEGATALLELMYEQFPTDQVVLSLLRNAYEDTRSYAKEELLARRIIGQNPDDYVWRLYLAESLAKQGQTGPAEQAYRDVFTVIQPGDSGRLYGVFNSMMAFGEYNEALDMIDTLRAHAADKRAFGLQRGMMLQQDRRYADATKELLLVLSGDSTYAANDAEKSILAMLDYAEATPDVERVLSSETGEAGGVRSLRLLMTYAIKSGQYDRAFTFAVRQDSLQKNTGLSLVEYVRQCLDRKGYAAAVKGSEYLLGHYQAGPFLAEISFRHAEALAKLGRHAEALAAYEKIGVQFPTAAERGDALCAIGELYENEIGEPLRAIAYFDSVVTLYPHGYSYLQALRMRPYCYILAGKRTQAADGLRNIVSGQYSDDVMEEARFRLAQLLLFDHQFDSSKAALKKLMVDYPRGLYVNDAMQMVIDLNQVLPDTALLNVYADAVWYDTRRRPDSAIVAFSELAGAPDARLADVALYRLAGLELSRSDSSAALEALNRLTNGFPESFYRPYGLKLKADVMVGDPARMDQAKEILRELLEKYPNFPFVSDARKRLRQLEEGNRVG